MFAPAPATGLWRVPASGGTPRPATALDYEAGERSHRWPELLPGGRHILFTVAYAGSVSFDEASIVVETLDSGERRRLVEGGSAAHYVSTGHLVYARAGRLLAVPFDAERLAVVGAPVVQLDDLRTEPTGAAQFGCSETGCLVYAAGGSHPVARHLARVDLTGAVEAFPAVRGVIDEPRLSPDGRRIALGIRAATSDLWAYDLARGALTRLTFEGDNFAPVWTPDGERIVFSSNRAGTSGIYCQPSDGSGVAAPLRCTEIDQVPGSWSPDGQVLLLTEYHPDSGADLWCYATETGRTDPFLRTRFNEYGPAFSPDGRWVAYTSDESGRPEVYVVAYPGADRKCQLSTDGGAEPI